MKDLQNLIIETIGGKHKAELREDLARREINEKHKALMREMDEIVARLKTFYEDIDAIRSKWRADALAESWKYYQEEDSHYLSDDQEKTEIEEE